VREKKRLRKLFEENQRNKREKEEEELKNLRKETEVWNYINKKREKRRRVGCNIGTEE